MKKAFSILLIAASVFILPAMAKKPAFKSNGHNKNLFLDEGTKIKLILDGKTFDLQSYNLNYYVPPVDKSTTVPVYQSSAVMVNLRSSKIDQELLDWILSPDAKPKDAQIIVYEEDTNKTVRKIILTGVKPASYTENSNLNNITNRNTTLNLRYQSVSIKL